MPLSGVMQLLKMSANGDGTATDPGDSGMVTVLKKFGVDTEKIKRDAEVYLVELAGALQRLNENQLRMEAKLDRIAKLVEEPGETTELKTESGESTGVLLTTEKFPDAMIEDVGVSV